MRESIFKSNLKNKIRVLTEFYRLGLSGVLEMLRARISKSGNAHWYYYYMTLLNSRMRHVSLVNDVFTMQGKRGYALARTGKGYADLECFNQVFGREEYIEFQSLLTRYFDGRARYIVDAGANVGYFTLFLKSIFPDAAVLAIEPEKENFSQLQANCSLNHLTDISLINAGVWNKSTFLKFVKTNPDLGSWAFSFHESIEKTDIYAEDFNGLIRAKNWPRIDILKIDIEGTEAILFDNGYMDEILSITRVIGIEIHGDMIDGTKVVRELERAGFDLYTVGDMHFGHNKNLTKK